jgi:hypothetical protein
MIALSIYFFCGSVKQLRNTGNEEQVKWNGLGASKLVLISQLLFHSYPSAVLQRLNVLAQCDSGKLSYQEKS